MTDSYPKKALDVSNNNGRVNWSHVHGDGFEHAFAKATEGQVFIDGQVRRNAEQARAAGVKLGLYHYAHPAESPRDNAKHFLSVASSLVEVGDPAPTLDLEITGGLSPAELWSWQHTFCELVGEALETVPMLYSFESFLADSIVWPVHHRPLWGAAWGSVPDGVLDGWHVWQYSASGRVNGISGLVDLDSILQPLPTIGRKP